MQIHPVENVLRLVPSIVARIALEASCIVGNVSWRRITVAHFTLLRSVNHQFWHYSGLKPYIFQYWNGNFFERASLKSLGLRIQLGHRSGATCVNPKRSSNDDFVVIDCNGIHKVSLDYCACEGAKSAEVQLLRSSLYPVTSMNPKSAATFRVMKFFHILSFESKCSGYEFYNTLSRCTDNVGVNSSRVRFPSSDFMKILTEIA
jgi:hypothetical protein